MLPHAFTPVNYESIVSGLSIDYPERWKKAKCDPNEINWFVGQVMVASRGKAHPRIAREHIEGRL